MNTRFFPVKTGCLAVCCILLLFGCEKGLDQGNQLGDGDLKECNIKTITANNPTFNPESPIDTIVYSFTYNNLGDPVSVLHGGAGTGNPSFLFTYDKYHRLTQFLQAYSNGSSFEQWNKYGYNAKGQIVRDTTYAFGAISSPGAFFASYQTYKYDSEDRLVHETDSNYFFGAFRDVTSNDYLYDAKGNLVRGVAYDDKLNMNRTNKVWMFITKDYSVNNPFIATKYNEHGLPLDIDASVSGLRLIPAIFGLVKVDYQCR